MLCVLQLWAVSLPVIDGMILLGKAHTCSCLSHRSLAKVAYETISLLVWFNTDQSAFSQSAALNLAKGECNNVSVCFQGMLEPPWFCLFVGWLLNVPAVC